MELHDVYQVVPAPYGAKELSRYVEDELRRIADLKEDRLNQADIYAAWTRTIGITVPPAVHQRIMQPGVTPDYIVPDIMWSAGTALVTAPYDGVYKVKAHAEILTPGGTSPNTLYIDLGVQTNWAAGFPARWTRYQSEQAETISHSFMHVLSASAGDTIDVVVAVTAGAHTATVDMKSYVEIKRLR